MYKFSLVRLCALLQLAFDLPTKSTRYFIVFMLFLLLLWVCVCVCFFYIAPLIKCVFHAIFSTITALYSMPAYVLIQNALRLPIKQSKVNSYNIVDISESWRQSFFLWRKRKINRIIKHNRQFVQWNDGQWTRIKPTNQPQLVMNEISI